MDMHRQTWTKVNVPVDEGVRGIVSALSQFPTLETVESCQDANERGAWVCFRYGKYWKSSWKELSDFVLGYLAPGLLESVSDDANLRIQVTPSGQIFGELSVRPGAEHRVESALKKLADGVSVYQLHSSECSGDTIDSEIPW